MRILAITLTFLLAGSLMAQKTGPAPSLWPFGKGQDRRSAGDGYDLWNLGVLGAKACNADKPPKERATGTQRFSTGGDDRSTNDGPKRLRIDALFPAGPAETSRLRVGDVVVGVGSEPFQKHSMPQLAEALAKAEGNREKPTITLLVETASGKTKSVVIKIPPNPEASNPTTVVGRAKIAKKALAFLASKQDSDGGYSQTLSGVNGAVVQASLAGLCWLADGSSPARGTYSSQIAKARAFVTKNLLAKDDGPTPSGGANWDQTNWRVTYGMMFLAECQARELDGAAQAALKLGVARLESAQVESGGFGHGPGGPNALGYIELNIVGGLVIKAVGAAKSVGCRIDEVKARRLLRYLEASGGGDGGVGYSTGDGQKGHSNIGRTAISWLGALQAAPDDGFTTKLRTYTESKIGDVLGGHASYLQHVSFAGLAACALSTDVEKKFIEATARDLTLNRAPDGSLQPRPWHESIMMSSNSDVSVGEIWSTACQLLPLIARVPKTGAGGLPITLGQRIKRT